MIPNDLALTAEEAAKLLRLRKWAADQLKILREAELEKDELPSPPQLPMAVPQPEPQPQRQFQWPKQFEANEATRMLAARLAAGPRVGLSPASVMDM